MKKVINQYHVLTFFLVIVINSLHAQEKVEGQKLQFGIQAESILLRGWMSGITPAITFQKGRSELMIGPRLLFKNKFDLSTKRVGGDLGYRWTLFQKNDFRLTVEARLELGFQSANGINYFPEGHISSGPGAPFYDTEGGFYYEFQRKQYSLGLYGGLGVEQVVFRNFYLKGLVAFGGNSFREKSFFKRNDNGGVERIDIPLLRNVRPSAFLSFGVGYRFVRS